MKITNPPGPMALKYAEKFCLKHPNCWHHINVLAGLIEKLTSKPYLGTATTGQLLQEIKARVDLNYRTWHPGDYLG